MKLYTTKGSKSSLPNHQVITLKHFLQMDLISSGVFGGNVVLHTPNSP